MAPARPHRLALLWAGLGCLLAADARVPDPDRLPIKRQVPRSTPKITFGNRQLLVDGSPIHIKGVCWNPIPYGGEHPASRDWARDVVKDATMMQEAGINSVRTYDPIDDWAVLDEFWKRGIFVVMNVYIFGAFPPEHEDQVAKRVNAVKDHPSILFWEIGNEWNYNHLYQKDEGLTLIETRDRVKRAVDIVKANDPHHPVATNIGEIGIFYDKDLDLLNVLSNVDIWGLNVYREATFGTIFDEWVQLSDKPMFLGEFGADAWDARPEVKACNVKAQADATRWLTEQIVGNSSIYGGAVFGGWIFEFADEWWKDSGGRLDMHDVGGIAPGGGPYPDKTFNEEWWGLVDLWRTPRPAWWEYAKIAIPVAGFCPAGAGAAACAFGRAASTVVHVSL